MTTRCKWCENDPLNVTYHDEEWGQPAHDDDNLFEKLILETMEAGLSWILILRKRENFREAFDNFDANIIAQYDDAKVEELLQNAGIIRQRSKIMSAITNAQKFLEIQAEYGSFDAYIWQFVNGQPIINRWETYMGIPAETTESIAMSKALKKRGFKFVGSKVCYAFMQACGMVNDHVTDCFLHPDNQTKS
jgi:DNA-3-methyladenine glycosylase I